MKSYTDIEQSKKLAKFLPLESADMLWGYYYNGKNHCIPNIRPFRDGRNEIPKCYIPAWSLAALLSVLPKSIIYTPNPTLDGYSCKNIMHDLETYGDNPVDACYEMVIKLHEQKLI